jgi:ankyrin repeat protein
MYLLITFPNRTELLIKYITDHPDQINEQNDEGWTSLMIVARNAQRYDLRILKSLIENGAKSTIKNNNGHTALKLAIIGNHNLAVIDNLLKIEGYHSKILIRTCTFNITNRFLVLMLKHGINPDNQTNNGVTALMILSSIANVLSMTKILLIHGANQYIKTNNTTALDIAISKHGKEYCIIKLYQTYTPEL